MICTVTFNPSLDYVLGLDSLRLGGVNRASREAIMPGGKGINVSIVLNNLGHPSHALGFIAGFTGDEIARRLADMGIETDFIPVDGGMSRINVKISAEEETEVNGMGPDIPMGAIGRLFGKLDALGAGDVLVVSGSVPSSLPADIYERIGRRDREPGPRRVRRELGRRRGFHGRGLHRRLPRERRRPRPGVSHGALHGVGERVLAGARYARAGRRAAGTDLRILRDAAVPSIIGEA